VDIGGLIVGAIGIILGFALSLGREWWQRTRGKPRSLADLRA
jgi:hypothetical protein